MMVHNASVWSSIDIYCTMFVMSRPGVQIDWQCPLSGVHSIMMINSDQPGEGGGAPRPTSFTQSSLTGKVVVYAPAERADTVLLFLLYPFLLCGLD